MQVFVNSVSDPKSPNYRKFISPKEIGARFGASPAEVKRISDYLAGYGMKVHLVADNRLAILADATVSQAQAAFNTSIEEFAPIQGGMLVGPKRFSFTTAPNLPVSINKSAFYVGGLENFTQPKAQSALTPSQLRTLYSVSAAYANGIQGQGRTVGISNFVGYRLSNVNLEYSQFNLPTPSGGVTKNIIIQPINGMDGSTTAENAEGDIDIQTVLAVAPLCTLIVYDDGGDSDLIGTLTKEAQDNKADIISESYGWFSGDPSFYVAAHNQHLAMSAEGITYMCASGDQGTTVIDPTSKNFTPYPDEDPDVLIVGGTTVGVNGAGVRASEVGWTGSGGGWVVSTDPFNQLPAYQKGKGVPTNIPYRLVPDVALDSDPATGYQIYVQGQLQAGWGGTSCASPTFAGALAVCEQQIIAQGGLPKNSAGKQRFGRIQDLLYSFNGDATVFFDVISGSNGTLPNKNPSNAVAGWDTVTGWDPVIFSGFVNKVLAQSGGPSTVTFSPTSVLGGTSTVGTVTLTAAAPVGGMTVALTSNSSAATVPSTITVNSGKTSATFTVNTTAQTTDTTVKISATANGTTVSSTLVVQAPGVGTVAAAPSTVTGGTAATGTVTLNSPAPAAGMTVTLTSSSTSVTVPASVKVAGGTSSATFSITTKAVASNVSATVTAKHGTSTTSGSLTVIPATVKSIAVSPNTAVGGKTVVGGTVTLTGPAPSTGTTITLSSSNTGAATVPAMVKVASGATSGKFTVTTKAVGTTTVVTITGKFGTNSQSGTLTVQSPIISALVLKPATVKGISTTAVTGTVTIGSPAPAGGLNISLSSANMQVANVPQSITIAAGKTTGTFSVSHVGVSAQATISITASSGGTSKSAVLTVTP